MTDHTAIVVTVPSDQVCEVQPVIGGQDANAALTLTCRMTYDWQAPGRHFLTPPGLNVSLSWTGVPGTTVTTTADLAAVRGTLVTSTKILTVTSQAIPSCNCTIRFDFSPGSSPLYQYAVNSVSSTCVTEPTSVWSKFKI